MTQEQADLFIADCIKNPVRTLKMLIATKKKLIEAETIIVNLATSEKGNLSGAFKYMLKYKIKREQI